MFFFLWQYQRQRKCFLSERELRKALRDTLTRASWLGPGNFWLVRSEHAHASYPGLFFRPPGFSPYMGREESRVQGLDYGGESCNVIGGQINRKVSNFFSKIKVIGNCVLVYGKCFWEMFSRNFLSSNVFLSQFSKHLTGLLNKSFSPVVTFMNSFHKQHVCAACNNTRLVPQFGKYDCSSHLFFHFNFSLILLYLQLRCMYMLLPCILFPLPYGFK